MSAAPRSRHVLDVVVTGATIAANGVAAYSDFTRGHFAVGMSAKVGVPLSVLPMSGTLKTAGAAGLALGLSGVPVVGTAAGTGLVLFFCGAVGVHLRAREHRYVLITSGYLALAVGSLVLAAVRRPVR
ncbi:DoxX family protein [Virgisporangium aurantiacum]|uniref:DoxX-like family protein n=1 Tax=Virgisporangium aurantiacum TaxID=175570 RepID=A0A8J3YZ51_9ACTN|nr:DoxX family protein [Virgisporangium aurantiacum]GIJ54406.1 hypothetical protein Vau01_019220 [Virgisporangium aurantiacum]